MCTLEKQGNLFILTLTGAGEEHRLHPTVMAAVRSAISQIKSQSTAASALITTAAPGKFFCNGLDLAWASSGGSNSVFVERLALMLEDFKAVVAELLSLPMPTIAAVTGHAAAAGFVLAVSHDYVLMRRDRGVMYMSELDIGLTFPEYFTAMLREKVATRMARKEVMLKAAKLRAEEAVKLGIVDSAYDSAEETVSVAMRLGKELAARKWNGEVYAEIRKGMYPELCKELGLTSRPMVAPRL